MIRITALTVIVALSAIADAAAQSNLPPNWPRPIGGRQGGPSPENQAISNEQYAIQQLIRSTRYDEAERRARAAIAQLEGREHPTLAWALANLGWLQRTRGQMAEARRTIERAREFAGRNPQVALATRAFIAAELGHLRKAEGRADEALALARESVALREQDLPAAASRPNFGSNLNGLAYTYMDAGRADDAAQTVRRAIAAFEQQSGPDHIETAWALHSAAQLLQNATPTTELRAWVERARLIAERSGEAPLLARILSVRGYLFEREGRYAEAEADLRRALPILSRGGDEMAQATAQVRLANVLAQRAATAEAEQAVRQAMPVIERHLGREHPLIGFALTAQGRTYRLAGRPAEAEPILRRAIAVRQRAIANDPGLDRVRVEHALALEQLGRAPEAITALEPASRGEDTEVLRTLASLYARANRPDQAESTARRALAAGERSLGADAPRNAATRALLGFILVERGRATEAEPHLRAAVTVQERSLGARHPDLGATWYGLARALEAQGKLAEALEAARRATQSAVERVAADEDGAERMNRREVFALLVSVVGRVLPQASAAQQAVLLTDAFRAMQRAKEGPTAVAVARMAERASAENPRLAELLRARSDAIDAVALAASQLRAAAARGGGSTGALEAARARRADLDRRLAREFPAYARLFGTTTLSVADMSAALGPDEALVDLLVLPQRVVAMVIRADGARLVASDARDVPALVRRLRTSVDPTNVTNLEQLPAFDTDAAQRLWQATMAAAMPHLDGVSHLFIVPDGPLQSVPFAMLLTGPVGDDLRQAPWLLRRFATTTLPAASTLRALRVVARPTQASEAFVGVGDPVLAGLPGQARGRLRGRPPELRTVFTRSGVADVRRLRELAPLPETADELRSLARVLGAGGDALILGREATEQRIRTMDLSRYRVIAFATHGLTAGEVPGYGEPGLVLTPPERATPEDDGVLGVSTIARLRLDADLVILSACNTAAPDGTPGAEALSGLARAFLYAGARSLLASHWPVVSQTAVELTTGMFAAQATDPTLGRAETLRRSQLAYVARAASSREAHPLIWAPFVLVGEGGRPIAVPAQVEDEPEIEPAQQ